MELPEPEVVSACGDAVPSCPVDRCASGRCSLVRLAQATGEIFAVDDAHVYWASAREIARIPKCGGPTEIVALSRFDFSEVRAHGDALYVRFDAYPQKLYRLPKTLGPSEERAVDPEVTVGQTLSLAIAGDHAYVSHPIGIVAFPLAGGPGVVIRESGVASSFGRDDARVYYYSSYPEAGFFALDGLVETVFSKPEVPISFVISASASDGESLYVAYAAYEPVTLYRVGRADVATPLAKLDTRPEAVQVDDRCVYVTSARGKLSGLRRVPKTGGDLEVVAAAGTSFALDEGAVYFTRGGELYRQPK
jgi:hypothetical protein